jgi:manganese transport protein
MLDTHLASLLFAVPLLAAGQSSTLTGTLAGQVVMEGVLQLRLLGWQRRLLTRGLALLPAMAAVLWLGERSTTTMLVLGQVVLSLQLPFAVVHLIWICGRAGVMGELPAPPWLQGLGWLCAAVILSINGALLLAGVRAVLRA